MRVLFFMSRPGHVRNYDETLRLLAARGHSVHLAFSSMRPKRNEPADLPQAEALAHDCPSITFGEAPGRAADGWDGVAAGIRLMGDFGRFLHPRYRDAQLLRDRASERLQRAIAASGPRFLTAPLSALVRVVGRRPSRALSAALVGFCRCAERAVPPSDHVESYVRGERAEVVLVTPAVEIGSSQSEYFKAARALGVPSGLCVASWDNLTNKGVLRADPEAVFVWNDVQRREAVEMHGIPHDCVVLTGAPRFDEWFRRRPSRTARTFKEEVELDPERPYLLYLASSPFIAPDEVSFVRRWLHALRTCGVPELEGVGVLIRPHPQNAAQWQGVGFAESDNAVIWPRAGAQVTDDASKADFFDSIAHSEAVVGINTSALIEASILGKSVFTVLAPEFEGTQQGTLHYHYLREENGGFLREAATIDDHVVQLRSVLLDNELGREQTLRFVESFVRPLGLDVAASERLAGEIEALATSPIRPLPASARASVLRVVLTPIAGLARLRARWRSHYRQRVRVRQRLAARLAGFEPFRRAASWLVGALTMSNETEAAKARDARLVHDEFLEADRRARRLFAGPPDRAIVGPWRGDAISEALYWIPYLRWLAQHHELPPSRVVVLTASGVPAWYDGLAGACLQVHDSIAIPPSALETAVSGLIGGAASTHDMLRRMRYVPLPVPRSQRSRALPPGYVVLALAGADGLDLDEAVGARLAGQTPLVIAGSDPPSLRLGEESLIGRRRGDVASTALSSLIGGARAVIGLPNADAVALGVCHGVRTIAVCPEGAPVDWPRVDLLVRASHMIGSSFTLLDAAQLDLVAAIEAASLTRARGTPLTAR